MAGPSNRVVHNATLVAQKGYCEVSTYVQWIEYDDEYEDGDGEEEECDADRVNIIMI